MKIPHLVSQEKERNHFKTEDPRVAHPAGKHVVSGVPSPTTLQQQLDTSVKHLPCRKLDPKDQTRGGTLSPGQDSNSSPLKTLGKPTQLTEAVPPQQSRALDLPGREDGESSFCEPSEKGWG